MNGVFFDLDTNQPMNVILDEIGTDPTCVFLGVERFNVNRNDSPRPVEPFRRQTEDRFSTIRRDVIVAQSENALGGVVRGSSPAGSESPRQAARSVCERCIGRSKNASLRSPAITLGSSDSIQSEQNARFPLIGGTGVS